jgi:hypothetical protein
MPTFKNKNSSGQTVADNQKWQMVDQYQTGLGESSSRYINPVWQWLTPLQVMRQNRTRLFHITAVTIQPVSATHSSYIFTHLCTFLLPLLFIPDLAIANLSQSSCL